MTGSYFSQKRKVITSSSIESVILGLSALVYAGMVAAGFNVFTIPHMFMRDSPECASVPWRARPGPPCPKKQREMTLEGVCFRRGAYDNTRSV